MASKFAVRLSSYGIDLNASVLGIVVAILLLKLLMRNRKAELLAKLPGPRPYPFVGNLPVFLGPREKVFQNIIQCGEQYGSIFRLWMGGNPSVHLSDPEYIESHAKMQNHPLLFSDRNEKGVCVFAHSKTVEWNLSIRAPHSHFHPFDSLYLEVLHNSKHLRKGFAYKFLEPFLGSGLITSNGEKWLRHRKILTPAFHFKILDSFFEVFREQSKILIEKLDKKLDSKCEFDVYDYVKYCALDIICGTRIHTGICPTINIMETHQAAMGVKIHAQNSSHSEYVNSVLRLSTLIVERSRKLWLHPDIVFNRTKYGKEQKRHLDVVHKFVENIIQERKKLRETSKKFHGKESKPARLAFLDLLLETTAERKITLTDENLREEVDTFMFAGHDTTTAAITWALYMVGLNPEVQEALFEEQKKIFNGQMDKPITPEDIEKMKLLDRVIKESLRLYPSVPFISRYLDEDVKFGDYLVPKETTAILHIYLLHRNPKIYPEPEKFDPDRFLPENMDKRDSYSFIPFSAGPRNCIGKRFALLEEKFILSSLVRRYEIESMEKPKELNLVAELILRVPSGIKIKLRRRMA